MAPNLNADALRLWTCDLDTLFGEWHIKLNDGVTKKSAANAQRVSTS